MTQPDWDDERLAAAFHARFDRPAPPDLAGAVHGAISGTSPGRASWFRPVSAWATVAAAVVLVAVGGAAVLGLGGLGRPGSGSPGPSGSTAAATPSSSPSAMPTPTAQALPGSVFGLPIVHVTDAIAVRDANAANTELAVMGWFTPAPPLTCTPAPPDPLQRQCPDRFVWLSEDAESLIHENGSTQTNSGPVDPALNPFLDGLDPSLVTLVTDSNGDSVPTDVVFVGHFGDRRAALCPAADQDACQKRFVVDSVAYVHGQPVPLGGLVHLTDTTPPVSFSTDIEAVIANETPQSPILSMAIVNGPVGLAQMEPSLANGQAGLANRPVLWVARVLEGESISTYIVIDGTDAIFQMNPNNEAILVGGSVPPSASPGPWPPAGATVVTLTSQVAAGAPPVRVAVVDRSGRLVHVAEQGSVEPSDPSVGIADPAGYSEPGRPGRVHLAWTGSICDSRITVTVAADLKTIAFDMGPQPLCDSIGVGRQVVLDFSGSIDVPTIEVFRNP